MAGSSNKVTLGVGLVSIAVRIEPAVDKESSGLRTVCLGSEGEPHDPARVQNRVTCPVCDTYHSSTFGFKHRADEVGDKLTVLSSEDIAAAKGTPRTGKAGQPAISIAFHSREKVYAATVAGDSVQNVSPDKGGEKAYVVLRDTLAASPDIVACMIWAPSSANALWVLEVVGDRIVASKRSWPEYVRATTAIPEVNVSEMEREMFSQFVDDSVTDFDLSVYSDQATAQVKALVNDASSGAVAAATAPAGQVDDLLAALQRSMEDLKGTKAPAKKTAARKAPAKKAAPARKPAAKKAASTRKKVA